MNNSENIRKLIINNNKNDIFLIKKKFNSSFSFNDILYNKIIIPKEKISSPYNILQNISILDDILDISELKNNKFIINKNKFLIKNRSLSCDSLLNYYNIKDSMYRKNYNNYLAFHNIIHK